MPTTSSIGTSSRNYSTIGAWLAAFTTGGWIGQCYNDSEFVETVSFSGQATSVTDFITLGCAAGQSFFDNVNAQTNALRYNQANGVGVRFNTSYSSTIVLSEDSVTLNNLQIQQSNSTGRFAIDGFSAGSGPACLINGCILETFTNSSLYAVLGIQGGVIINSLLVNRNGSAVPGVKGSYGGPIFANCTLVRPSDFTPISNGFQPQGTGHPFVITNCAVFGFSAFTGNTTDGGSNNATDLSTVGFGTSNQVSLTYTSQFVTTTASSSDFKIKVGSQLIDAGTTDVASIPAAIDIVGTSRPQGSAWDIGAWELIQAAAAKIGATLSMMGVG